MPIAFYLRLTRLEQIDNYTLHRLCGLLVNYPNHKKLQYTLSYYLLRSNTTFVWEGLDTKKIIKTNIFFI